MLEKPSANTVFVSLLLAASASAKMSGELDHRFSTNNPRLKDPLVSFQGKRCGSPVSLDETLARETREAALCVLTAPASYFDKADTDQFLTNEYGTLFQPRVRLPQNRTVKFRRDDTAYEVSVYNEKNGTTPGNHNGQEDFIYINVRPKDAPKNVKVGNHIEDTGLTGSVSLGADISRRGHEYAPCYDTPVWEDFLKRDYCMDRLRSQRSEEEMEVIDRVGIDDVRCDSEGEAAWPEEYKGFKEDFAAKKAKYEAMYREGIDAIRAHCQERLERARLRPRQRR